VVIKKEILMKFSKINFLKSSPNTIQCPKSNFKEIAFIGRSNVGKSSLINMLFNNKNLAKISKKPGKTKLINHFIINDTILLADLPGYGYAKLSKVETKKINEIIQDYIENRKNLTKLFLLIDIRHELIKTDLLFINYLDNLKKSFHIIFTKSDKVKSSELSKKSNNYIKNIKSSYLENKFFVSSSSSTNGKEEILNFIMKQ
jgi:GTP-binding protein